MITLTKSAERQIALICGMNLSHVRISLRSGGCAGYSYDWSLDTPTQDDCVVSIGDYGLIIDSHSQSLLGDVCINFIQGDFESSWEIDSASATASCGCGKSVFIKQDGTSKLIDESVGGCNG
jgi:iron-sulfur cluster assembly accessory protein